MALFFTEEEVGSLLTMEAAIEAVEEAFRQLADGQSINRPRARVGLPGVMLHVMPAGSAEHGMLGFKAYIATKAGARFLFHLYRADGELLAVMEAGRLGQIRTGAVAAVRAIERAVAFGRDVERRRVFCEEMSQLLDLEVHPAKAPREVPREADILITATTAREPVLHGKWVRDGQHINAIGSNMASRQEIDEEVIRRAALIVVDSKEQALLECGDLIAPISSGATTWERIPELGEVVRGRIRGRSGPKEVTLFESQGIAIEDVAVARKVYELGRARGVGVPLPF
jgi:ornithine cyclodeaminase/alanine dehydrogenase-like protein (mu-crystallin family)